jgi:hypothetical protein
LPDWIGSHVRAFAFYDGLVEILVPDFVPGNKIGLLFPPALCARTV